MSAWIFICATLIFGMISESNAKNEIESYPLIGSVSTGLTWNHSHFVGSERSESADQYQLPSADGFGWSLLNINSGLSYTWAFSPKLPPIFFSGGI